MEFLLTAVSELTWQMVVMWAIGGVLIYLAIARDMEPTLLLPIGFGAILANLPLSGAVTESGPLTVLFNAGIANELFPLLLFIGIGAMIDFGPLLSNPKLMLFGAAAQFGIFLTLSLASLFGFELMDAASIAIIGAADGPTSIFVANHFGSNYMGAITVAAYSYMALVPIIQPPVIRLCTTKKERLIRMPYQPKEVSRLTVSVEKPVPMEGGISLQHRFHHGDHRVQCEGPLCPFPLQKLFQRTALFPQAVHADVGIFYASLPCALRRLDICLLPHGRVGKQHLKIPAGCQLAQPHFPLFQSGFQLFHSLFGIQRDDLPIAAHKSPCRVKLFDGAVQLTACFLRLVDQGAAATADGTADGEALPLGKAQDRARS